MHFQEQNARSTIFGLDQNLAERVLDFVSACFELHKAVAIVETCPLQARIILGEDDSHPCIVTSTGIYSISPDYALSLERMIAMSCTGTVMDRNIGSSVII